MMGTWRVVGVYCYVFCLQRCDYAFFLSQYLLGMHLGLRRAVYVLPKLIAFFAFGLAIGRRPVQLGVVNSGLPTVRELMAISPFHRTDVPRSAQTLAHSRTPSGETGHPIRFPCACEIP